MVRIWAGFVAREGGPLPFIVPLVLYDGARSWNAPLDLHGLFLGSVSRPVRDALLAGVPQFRYELLDLSRTDDAELQGAAFLRLVLLLLKHAPQRDFWDRFPAWLDTLATVVREPPDGLSALEAVMRYVDDLDGHVVRLRSAGVGFRNTIEAGPGGRQIQIEDPDGNGIELHEAPR